MTEVENQATVVLLIGGVGAYFILSYVLDFRRKAGSSRMTFLQRAFAAVLFGIAAPIVMSEIHSVFSVLQHYLERPGSWAVDVTKIADQTIRNRSLLAVASTVAVVFSIEQLWVSRNR